MIAIEEWFRNKQDALAWMSEYLLDYAPQGYGTSLHLQFNKIDRCWAVVGYRFKSCD